MNHLHIRYPWGKKVNLVLAFLLVLAMLVPATAMPVSISATSAGSGYSRIITINSGQVQGTLDNFPVLISISNDSVLKTLANSGHVARADGGDIIFTDSTGLTQYPYEIENMTAPSVH